MPGRQAYLCPPFREAVFIRERFFIHTRRGARAVEWARLESEYAVITVSRVRIPPSPRRIASSRAFPVRELFYAGKHLPLLSANLYFELLIARDTIGRDVEDLYTGARAFAGRIEKLHIATLGTGRFFVLLLTE